MKSVFKKINSIGILVKNIDKTVKIYSDRYGIGPWSIYICDRQSGSRVLKSAKKNNSCGFKVASCFLGETGIKLVQLLDDDNDLFKNNPVSGENLHHIEYSVDNYQKVLKLFADRGMNCLIKGNFDDGYKLFFMDSMEKLKHFTVLSHVEKDFFKLEKLENGIGRYINPVPSYTYPPDGKIGSMEKPLFKGICQVALIVKDIDQFIRKYYEYFGIGPWRLREFGPETVYNMKVGDKRKNYRMKVAITRIGGLDIELIQPMDTHSIYYDFLKSNGEGLHHLAFAVEDFDKVIKYMDKLKIKVLMSGTWHGKHSWLYLDTRDDLKHIVELNHTEPGFNFPEPEGYFPPEE